MSPGMAIREPVKIIDQSVKDQLLRCPFVDLIRLLYPDVKVRRNVMCNPIRGEKHPSLSCFTDDYGVWHWKDHSTGEHGDNIAFFRKAFPEFGYVEAVDRMAVMVLGQSAVGGVALGRRNASLLQSPVRGLPGSSSHEQAHGLTVLSRISMLSPDVPVELLDYCRGRGISNEVTGSYFTYVTYRNNGAVGQVLRADGSGLPIVGSDGEPLVDDGVRRAVGLLNDIDGYSLREPGFKGTNMQFISTILYGGYMPYKSVSFVGGDDGRSLVRGLRYDASSLRLYVNDKDYFSGVKQESVSMDVAFLDQWTGRLLDGRDLKGAVAVMNALNCFPGGMRDDVIVVEGMFDAASVVELERICPGFNRCQADMVVLNSTSNLLWAVPFLSAHRRILSYLDNDLSSQAGKKAFDVLKREVGYFSARVGTRPLVRSCSQLFYPHKDVNDYLRHWKGLDTPLQQAARNKKSFSVKPK